MTPPARRPCCDPGLPRRLPHSNFVHVITTQRLAVRVTFRQARTAITVMVIATDSGSRAIRLAPFRVYDRIPLDVHGRIFWTPAAPERSRATSSASFSRSAVRNGARPAATTTNGSAGARPVYFSLGNADQLPGITEHIHPVRPPVPAPLHELQSPPEPRMERVNHTHLPWRGLI